MNEVFVSYSRRDFDFVFKLHKALSKAGLDCWFDWEDIPHAVPWRPEVRVAIQRCQNFVFVLSPNSLESAECLIELEHALLLDKRIIPIVAASINSQLIQPAIRELNWIFFNFNFQEGLKNLLKCLDFPVGTSVEGKLESKITIRKNEEEPREFYLKRSLYVLGRSPQIDIFLGGSFAVIDDWTSANQFTLIRQGDRWAICDGLVQRVEGKWQLKKPSTNGTLVNGAKLGKATFRTLTNEDIIRFSRIYITYEEFVNDSLPANNQDDARKTLEQSE